MKTVQEILRELDPEQLVDTYLAKNPISYDRSKEMTAMRVREIPVVHPVLQFIVRDHQTNVFFFRECHPFLF